MMTKHSPHQTFLLYTVFVLCTSLWPILQFIGTNESKDVVDYVFMKAKK